MSVKGNILILENVAECLQIISENGGKNAIIPEQIGNKISLLPSLSANKLNLMFYQNPIDLANKLLSSNIDKK